ncbi:MAG: hypothetical protein JO270_08930 [Acidobacteriaceae bacterium]|nr:hypothetical protein [Acidobacteriaceae bacterium]
MDHSLAAYLGDGPADSSVLRVFHRVLAAVDAIHASGSAHLPLSPQTIRLDGSDRPHIQCSERAHQTADTVAFGSAKYSAPEAFLHDGNSSSCEIADCYVLGFIFYEILIGRRSFFAQFASLENGPPSVWLKWHADQTVKARPLADLHPNLGHFASLIDAMMEKEPTKRVTSIPEVLRAFSSVETQTAHNADALMRSPDTPRTRFEAVRKRMAAAATWLAIRLAVFRKLRVAAAVLLAVGITIFTALLVHRETSSPEIRQTLPAMLPRSIQPTAKLIPKPPPPSPHASPEHSAVQLRPIVPPNIETQPPVPPKNEVTLQIESHLPSGALLFIDGLRRVALAQGGLFSGKITAGPHRLRLVTPSKAFVRMPLEIGATGEISFSEAPKVRSIKYVMLASSAQSAKLYAPAEARAGLAGGAYEPVPADGLVIGNGQAVNVSLSQNSKTEMHVGPLPAGSIKIVLEPGDANLRVPVEITANVPEASIVINGQKLARKLDKGVRVVRLPAGEYRVKLVRADYQDSGEQQLVISGNEQQRQLRFTLVPIVSPSNIANSSVPVHDSLNDSGAADVTAEAIKPYGKITFHIRPETAKIGCRRENESEVQDCPNNQPCVLRAGAYEVTARADGFKAELNHIVVGAGDDKPYEWKLKAVPPASPLNPADFFENGQTWTVDPNGWWTHTQPGYSFMRASRGLFVFDIVKPSGVFVSKKISLVVNYKDDGDRILYTVDEYKIQRNERAPGIQTDYSAVHEIPPEADYRLTLELSSDRVIIRNAAGHVLDNVSLAHAATGKVGFSGKLKLRVLQARYSQDLNSPAE